MDTVAYVPAVVAFLAVLVAIAGAPKWDSTKQGWRRLTLSGRATLVLATLALVASFGLTWRSQSEADVRRTQRERIRLVAHTELRLALHDLSSPFYEVLQRETGEHPSPFGIAPSTILDPQTRRVLASLDLNAPSPFESSEGALLKWGQVFSEDAKKATAQIDRVLQTYAAYLDADVLALVSEVRTSEFLELRLVGLEEYIKMNGFRGDAPLLFTFAGPDAYLPSGYEHFWNDMIELDAKLERDKERLTRWGRQ